MNGSPATSSIALGTVFGELAEARRQPSGEQRKGRHLGHAVCATRREWLNVAPQTIDFVPSKSKRKRTSLQARHRHGVAQPRLVLGVEHQEAAAARADQLAAERAVRHGVIVPLVDRRIGHPAGALLLVLPVLVHQLAELGEVAAFQRFEAAQAEILHVVRFSIMSVFCCLVLSSCSFRIDEALRE